MKNISLHLNAKYVVRCFLHDFSERMNICGMGITQVKDGLTDFTVYTGRTCCIAAAQIKEHRMKRRQVSTPAWGCHASKLRIACSFPTGRGSGPCFIFKSPVENTWQCKLQRPPKYSKTNLTGSSFASVSSWFQCYQITNSLGIVLAKGSIW